MQNGIEPFWTKPVAPKSTPTQNLWANTEKPDSWCLRVRQEEDGPRSPTHSSGSWNKRGPGWSPARCELQQEGRGSSGGARFACCAAQAFASSLLERRGGLGSDSVDH